MKKYYILIAFLLMVISLFSQKRLKLNKNVKIDTLNLWIDYPVDLCKDELCNFKLLASETVSKFNGSGTFFVKIDSASHNIGIRINMGKIKYVDFKKNVLSTGLTLALISGHALMISSYGWTFPIWPILLPATLCEVNMEVNPDIISYKAKTKYWISSNGYFISKEKQDIKFKKSFKRNIYKLLRKLDKQN